MFYGSMHIEAVKKLQEFQDIEVLFAWERGDHSHIMRSLRCFYRNGNSGKCCWDDYCIDVGKVQAKQKCTNLSLSDVIWLS